MRPRQFSTQCVEFVRKGQLELTHIQEIVATEPLLSVGTPPRRQTFHQVFAIPGARLPLLFLLNNRLPDQPTGLHHFRVDGAGDALAVRED